MPIKKLPQDVQSLLRASSRINTYKKAVEELVFNSLDAGSTSIAIRVNIPEGTLQVIDNGCGIRHSDLRSVGQRYMTSNYVDVSNLKSAPDKYGLRGEALANIVAVSKVVIIISRIRDKEETWVKTFLNGRENKMAITSTRPSKGTTIEIKEFLYNLSIQKMTINAIEELQNIRTFLEQVSLAHSNISLSLRDETKNEIIFQIYKNRDIYQTLHSLFNIEKNNIQELTVEKNEYKVTGYVGKNDESRKNWIYLNSKCIQANSVLHKIVNDCFNTSMNSRNKINVKSKVFNNGKENHSFRNIPFYFLFVSCPYLDYDVSHTPNHSLIEFNDWTKITVLLQKLIKFYTGDINLKPVTKPDYGSKNFEETSTRDEVKKIMTKVLRNKCNKPCISNMHNGIKGKLVKRKNKKKFLGIKLPKIIGTPLRNSFSKVYTEIVTLDCQNNDNVKCKSKSQKHETVNNELNRITTLMKKKTVSVIPDETQNDKALNELKFEDKQTTNKNDNKLNKRYNSCLKRKKRSTIKNIFHGKSCYNKSTKIDYDYNSISLIKDPIIKRFEACTDSVKQRCAIIAMDVEQLLNKFHKNERQIIKNSFIEHNSIKKNNKGILFSKNNNELINYDSYTKNLDDSVDYRIWKKPRNGSCRTNYDLLHTILQSQNKTIFPQSGRNCYQQQETNVSIYSSTHKSVEFRSSLIPHEAYMNGASVSLNKSGFDHLSINTQNDMEISNASIFFYSKTPNLTYESHRYQKFDIEEYLSHNNKKFNRKYQLVANKTKDDFVLNNNFFKPLNGHKIDKPTGTQKCIEFDKSKILYKLHQVRHSSAMSSNSIELCENVDKRRDVTSNNAKNDLKRSFDLSFKNNLTYNIPYKCKALYSSTYELIENTYEINRYINNFHKESITFEQQKLHKPQENYYNHDSQIKSSYFSTLISPISINKINETIRNNNVNVVFISNSQSNTNKTNVSKNSLEVKSICPMDIYETMLSNVDINSEFNKSFTINHMKNFMAIDNFFEIERKIDANCSKDRTPMNMQKIVNNIHENRHLDVLISNVDINYNDVNNIYSQDVPSVIDFDIRDRLRFLPKGMSQIYENCNTKTACDYNLIEDYFNNSIYNNFTSDIQINAEIYEQSIQNLKETATKGIDKHNMKLVQDNASLKFSGQQLKEAKILGQVDGKFIAALISGNCSRSSDTSKFLVLFDQHAVDERIQLEQNLSDYISNNQWKSVPIEFTLVLPEDEIIALHNYKEKFEQFGLQWIIFDSNVVKLNSIPLAILGKHSRQIEKISKAIRSLISEEVNVIKVQKGCISLFPKSIMDLVFSEACRYAVKFGDNLSKADCEELLRKLSFCKTPFQCAHGRPVMAVLTNYANNEAEYKINLETLKHIKSTIKN